MDKSEASLKYSLLKNMNDQGLGLNDNSIIGEDKKALAKAYSHNAPRILLETISARTAQIILISTYIIFLFGFVFDLRDTYRSFLDGNRNLYAYSCDKSNVTTENLWKKSGDWGCTFDSNDSPYWVGHIDDLTNVISIELQVRQMNISKVDINGTDTNITPEVMDTVMFSYDVTLFGCYDTSDCQWQLVLSLQKQVVSIGQIFRAPENAYVLNTFSNTFQNQEALPNKGKVKSYLAIVQYYGLDESVFDGSEGVTYEFLTVTRPPTVQGNLVLIFLVSVTTITSIAYCRAVYSVNPVVRKWLPEQKWIVWYFVALILYQNPVYCIICWQNQPTSLAVFTSYVLDAFGQAAFFVIWLLFSDGLRRKSNYFLFYIPKFTIGFLIFTFNLTILMLQFPSITPIDNRSPLLSVNNWSDELKLVFISVSIGFLLLLVIWITWWLYSLWSTGRTLQRLPYMSTRYLQLSFRFFTLQATLVALFYVFQYLAVIYLILRNSPLSQNLTSLTDNINTLFRLQTQLIGKQIFLTVYALTLAFLFLPAGLMDAHAVALAASYVINEHEIKDVVRLRRKAIRSMQALSQLAHAKCEVFCVDLALSLLDMAWEAYHDPPGLESQSGYGRMDLEKYGYKLIDYCYNEEHDTVCVVARHQTLNRIVVAFRGTSSKRHWSDNLNYTRKHVDMSAIGLPDLDKYDGLGVAPISLSSVLRSHAIESWPYDGDGDDAADTATTGVPMANLGAAILEVGDGIKKMASTVVGVTIGATTDLLVSAVAHTPGLKHTVQTYVHSGFWEAYWVVREFVHRTLRKELSAHPSQLFFTGHSLGGALASLAAVDVSLHTLPRINSYLTKQSISLQKAGSRTSATPNEEQNSRSDLSRSNDPTDEYSRMPSFVDLGSRFGLEKNRRSTKRKLSSVKVKANLYNFGSPRVGNWIFAQLTERVLSTNFRVVVDGDIVTGVPIPSLGYKHGGTEVIIDAIGAGSIIVDPSFVERQLRTQSKSSVRVHSLLVYRRGLTGVKDSAEFMREYARDLPDGHTMDSVRLALFAGPLIPESDVKKLWKSSREYPGSKDWAPVLLPTSSGHGDASMHVTDSTMDVSDGRTDETADVPFHSPTTRDVMVPKSMRNSSINDKDLKYGEKLLLHHIDDVKATEEMVSHWKMQQSLRVVPFRAMRQSNV